jgi:hypothetical protein
VELEQRKEGSEFGTNVKGRLEEVVVELQLENFDSLHE